MGNLSEPLELGKQYCHYIGGRWVAGSGDEIDIVDPRRGVRFARVPAGGAAQIGAAVQAARAQFDGGDWSRMHAQERHALILKLAELIERDAAVIARLEAMSTGRPVRELLTLDLPNVISMLRRHAGSADQPSESRTRSVPGEWRDAQMSYVRREPVGVIGAIVPGDAACVAACAQMGPALAAGCTIVIKPEENASLPVLHLASLVDEAGIPPGVVNVVTGRGPVAGAALCRHAGVNKISSAGSPPVGAEVARALCSMPTRLDLALRSKSSQIVFADADIDRAVQGCARGIFHGQGQSCAASTRILVQREVFELFLYRLRRAAETIVVGDPLDDSTELGPVATESRFHSIERYIASAIREGATLVTGGIMKNTTGWFVRPTLLAASSRDASMAHDVSGPVGTLVPFDSAEEAVRLLGDEQIGQGVTIWSNDVASACAMAASLRAGAVGINGSAAGRACQYGAGGVYEFMEDRVITIVL